MFLSLIFIFGGKAFYFLQSNARFYILDDIASHDWYKIKLSSFDEYKISHLNRNIFIIGDSISLGMPISSFSNEFKVYNYSIAGEDTVSLLNRIDRIPFEYADVVLFMIGVNDLGKGRTIESILTNYKLLFSAIKCIRCQVVVQSVIFTSPFKRDNEKIKELNLFLEVGVVDYGFSFFDVNLSLGLNYELRDELTYDGIHLKNQAYMTWIKHLNLFLNTGTN
ncbi:GDSL-type esterase/lipase family protein [Shewanella sp.]|uniref:GDSL-type esterase/lipase family protein n=1 Tax=Shewanella sp. TaxID=50422 RepID=UPI004047F1C3